MKGWGEKKEASPYLLISLPPQAKMCTYHYGGEEHSNKLKRGHPCTDGEWSLT